MRRRPTNHTLPQQSLTYWGKRGKLGHHAHLQTGTAPTHAGKESTGKKRERRGGETERGGRGKAGREGRQTDTRKERHNGRQGLSIPANATAAAVIQVMCTCRQRRRTKVQSGTDKTPPARHEGGEPADQPPTPNTHTIARPATQGTGGEESGDRYVHDGRRSATAAALIAAAHRGCRAAGPYDIPKQHVPQLTLAATNGTERRLLYETLRPPPARHASATAASNTAVGEPEDPHADMTFPNGSLLRVHSGGRRRRRAESVHGAPRHSPGQAVGAIARPNAQPTAR